MHLNRFFQFFTNTKDEKDMVRSLELLLKKEFGDKIKDVQVKIVKNEVILAGTCYSIETKMKVMNLVLGKIGMRKLQNRLFVNLSVFGEQNIY